MKTTILLLMLASCCYSATYYVDFENGSDSNSGTSEGAAWKHCTGDANAQLTAKNAVLAPGDTIKFKGGVIYRGSVYATRHGNSTNRIIYSGDTWGNNRAILCGDEGGYTNQVGFACSYDYITVSGFELTNYTVTGIRGTYADYMTVTNNVVHDIGYEPRVVNRGHGTYFASFTDVLVVSNTIYRTGYTCVNGAYATNVIVSGNTLYDSQVDGVNIWGYGYTIIDGNTIYNMTNGVTHGDGMQILGAPKDALNVYCNNKIWDCTQIMFLEPYVNPTGSATQGVMYVFNNVLYNSIPGTNGLGGWFNGLVFDFYTYMDTAYVFNNTIVDFNSGSGGTRLSFRSSSLVMTNFYYYNNLLYNSTISALGSTNVINKYSDYNYYTNQWRSGFMSIAGSSTMKTLAEFQAAYPALEQNSRYGTIEFGDYANGDFRRVSGVLLGTNLTTVIGTNTFDAIPERWRPTFLRDISGNLRSDSWDIGAYASYYKPKAQITSFSPASGSRVDFPAQITLTCTNLNSTIYWSTNGTATLSSSNGPSPLTITLGAKAPISAFATAPNSEQGDLFSASYNVIYGTIMRGVPTLQGPMIIR